jgi:hypothetical protein
LSLGSFSELFQVTGFFYGGTFSHLFFAGDGGGDLAHTLCFSCPGGCCPPGAVLREGYEERECFSFLNNFMGDRRHVFVKLRVEVFHPYPCCTTYGFFRIGQSSTQDPTAFISTLLPNCWRLFE